MQIILHGKALKAYIHAAARKDVTVERLIDDVLRQAITEGRL